MPRRSPGSICRSCWRRTLMHHAWPTARRWRAPSSPPPSGSASERPRAANLGGRAGQGDLGRQAAACAGACRPQLRQALALAMLEDVLAALAEAPALGGDRSSRSIRGERARRAAMAPNCIAEGARRRPYRRGHGRRAAPRRARRRATMLTVPGDIPLVTAAEIGAADRGARPAARLHDRAGA